MRFNASFSMLTMIALLACVLMPGIADAAPNCTKYAGLANHIAGCIRDTLDETVYIFFDHVFPMFKRAIFWFLIIGVSVFGVMAAFGMLEKVGRDSIMLLLKVSAISYFVANSEDLYNFTLLAMDSSAQAVVNFVPTAGHSDNTPGSDFNQITCLKNMAQAQGSGRYIYIKTIQKGFYSDSVSGPWMAMDCMIDSVIGIRVPDASGAVVDEKSYNGQIKKEEKGLSRGLVYLFFSTMQSSAVGIAIAILGLVFIWGLINLLIKALFIYIAGYIGIAILMIFAPLFVPMVLFQATRSYFDKWMKMIISFSLQPVIVLVFVAFTISAVDLATFSGKYSIMYALAGDESQRSGFSINEYLTRDRGNGQSIIDSNSVTYSRVKADNTNNIELTDSTIDTLVKGLDNSKCTNAVMNGSPTDEAGKKIKEACKQSYPLAVYLTQFNWDLLAKVRIPAIVIPGGQNPPTAGEQAMRQFMASLVFAAIVVFIMNQLLMVIPKVANDLLGEFGQTPNLGVVGGVIPGQNKLKSAFQSAMQKSR